MNQHIRILDTVEEQPENFPDTIENKKESQPQLQKKLQIQQEFIRRNYDTFKERQNKSEKEK